MAAHTVPAVPVQGAQVVGRVAALLRLVGRKPEGMSLAGLVRESGLTRPTAYRLLTSLAAEGLVEHEEATGKWVRGRCPFSHGGHRTAVPAAARGRDGGERVLLHQARQRDGVRPAGGRFLPCSVIRFA